MREIMNQPEAGKPPRSAPRTPRIQIKKPQIAHPDKSGLQGRIARIFGNCNFHHQGTKARRNPES